MIHHGDLFAVLPTLAEASMDACVTDPPYGLGFMAKEWDVPGGIGPFPMRRRVETDAVNTGASRQGGRQRSCVDFQRRQHRDAQAMQTDAERWARAVYRVLKPGAHLVAFGGTRMYHRLAAGIEDAGFEIRDCLSWLYGSGFPKSLNVGNGQGTALKPAWEPIILARKPTIGTVAANVLQHSTGALNIQACRIGDDDTRRVKEGGAGQFPHEDDAWKPRTVTVGSKYGRWPANVLLDEEAAAVLDTMTGELTSGANPTRRGSDKFRDTYSAFKGQDECDAVRGLDVGGASRFYYVAKPSREERDYGCGTGGVRNSHPTVKPIEAMRWLVKLVTPIGGTVLDPFTGSGTTGMACRYEQREFIGIEREAAYVAIAERRIAAVAPLFAVDAHD